MPPPPPVPQESVMEEEDLNGVQPGWLFAGSSTVGFPTLVQCYSVVFSPRAIASRIFDVSRFGV